MKRLFLTLLMLPLVICLASAAANDRRISDNDGDVLNINADGTLPVSFGSGPVNIDGDLYLDGSLYTTGGTTGYSYILAGSNTLVIQAGTLQKTGTGNFGIGVTAPDALLDVGGGTRTKMDGVNDLLVKDAVEVDGNVYVDSALYVGGATFNGTAAMQVRSLVDGARSGLSVARVDGGSAINIWSDTSARGRIDAGTGGSSIILNSGSTGGSLGSVGIGTTVLSARVTIAGSAYAASANFVDNNNAADLIVAGSIETDENLYVGSGTTVCTVGGTGCLYAAGGIETDKSIYAGYVNNYFKSPDGTCARCYVSDAEAWTCASATCPTGM